MQIGKMLSISPTSIELVTRARCLQSPRCSAPHRTEMTVDSTDAKPRNTGQVFSGRPSTELLGDGVKRQHRLRWVTPPRAT